MSSSGAAAAATPARRRPLQMGHLHLRGDWHARTRQDRPRTLSSQVRGRSVWSPCSCPRQDSNLRSRLRRGSSSAIVSVLTCTLWKAGLCRARLRGVNLRGADLRLIDARSANFEDAQLQDAKFRRSILKSANLQGAKLCGAVLAYSSLQGVNFKNADLRGTRLFEAVLNDADLRGARVDGADFGAASLKGVNVRDLDLRRVENLTQRQIDVATGDNATRLPENLTRPEAWASVWTCTSCGTGRLHRIP